jgi:acyl-CoA thioester hydrolase
MLAPPTWHWRMDVAVRWSDLDALGHVHHLALLRWCEDARNEHAVACGLPAPGSGLQSQVVVNLQSIYHHPVMREQPVQVRLRMDHLGTTSARSVMEVHAGDQHCVTVETVTVLCCDKSGRPVRWPDALRKSLSEGPPS